MLKIRLSQIGRSGQRTYRIRVMDSRRKRDTGCYLDDLGYWSKEKKEFNLDENKYKKWIEYGAQPSSAVKAVKDLLSCSVQSS
jgi:ribosomal protein S16